MDHVPLVIYHGGCPDGFACRWIHQRFIHPPRYPDPEYLAVFYNEPPPDVTGRDVFIYDFSYKRPIMEKMAEQAKSILCFDHHKTAQDELEGIAWCVFDMSRSGCGILWDEWGAKQADNMFRRIGAQGQLWTGQLESKEMGFHGRPDRPAFLAYIEDRDLWNFKYQKSKEINAAIYAAPMTMDGFDMLSRCTLEHLTQQGEVSLAVQAKLSESQANKAMEVLFAGHRVPFAMAPTMASETGHVLALGKPFSITWSITDKQQIKLELRSSKDGGLDVGQMARRMNGGGHSNAAGFHADWGQLTQMMQGFDIFPTQEIE